MQKFVGSLLIISATTGAGIMYGRGLKEELKKLMYLSHVISYVKGELEHAKVPFGFVFERLSGKVAKPYKDWFSDMAWQIERCKKESFSEIWADSAQHMLGGLGLKKQYIESLKNLGSYMDGANRDESVTVLAQYLALLRHETERTREAMYSRKRLGSCIGVMSGIFLVILLI